jgi:hypothetical protein
MTTHTNTPTPTTQDVLLTVRLTVRAGGDIAQDVRSLLERELPFGWYVRQVMLDHAETID